jgi:hypothetical protein
VFAKGKPAKLRVGNIMNHALICRRLTDDINSIFLASDGGYGIKLPGGDKYELGVWRDGHHVPVGPIIHLTWT